MTEEELVALCRGGDKNAWEELYSIYKPRVLKIARRFFLSGGETEDLVQEGMCGLYSAVNGYKQGENFSAYAYICIRNRIVDAVKKSCGAKNSALNNFLPIVEVGEEWLSPVNPEDEVIRREDRREFLYSIGKVLSSFEFKTIVMYTDGMTLSDIASALGTNVKSIDNALTRAKRKLQKFILTEH